MGIPHQREPISRSRCSPSERFSSPRKRRHMQLEKSKILRGDQEAWDIVLKNPGLVKAFSKKLGLYDALPEEYHEDINSIARQAMFMAARKWNPEIGTYANLCFSEMKSCWRQLTRLKGPVHISDRVRARAARVFDYMDENGCTLQKALSELEVKDTAASNGFTLSRLIEVLAAERTPSSGEGVFYGALAREDAKGNRASFSTKDSPSVGSGAALRLSHDELVFFREVRSRVANALNILSQKDRERVEMLFGLNGYKREYTQSEVGQKFGVSHQAVSQSLLRAIKQLREGEHSPELKELWEFSN